MAPAIAHFLVGASLLLLLTIPIALRYRLAPWIPLWLVALGGLWGLGPDIHHIAPVYEIKLRTVHDSPWVDLFAFHYTLDRPAVRAQYLSSVFGSILGFLGAVTTFMLATVLRSRTTLTETASLHLVALSEVLLLLLLVVAATSS
ncbi:hypothetical protein [Natrinema limicola]|uniref:Uncharacterized protein n=1 Tax=Natrinema limicola JCM 13563 TaxID=1230457 RepID=M0CGJ1_9EURY|nr:hypothetical protein [Natrinema limicola]ELZ21477.1 hypothetical protein C476_08323 [Natrinema limicola JCM 13563]